MVVRLAPLSSLGFQCVQFRRSLCAGILFWVSIGPLLMPGLRLMLLRLVYGTVFKAVRLFVWLAWLIDLHDLAGSHGLYGLRGLHDLRGLHGLRGLYGGLRGLYGLCGLHGLRGLYVPSGLHGLVGVHGLAGFPVRFGGNMSLIPFPSLSLISYLRFGFGIFITSKYCPWLHPFCQLLNIFLVWVLIISVLLRCN